MSRPNQSFFVQKHNQNLISIHVSRQYGQQALHRTRRRISVHCELTEVSDTQKQLLKPSKRPLEQDLNKSGFSIIEGKGDLLDYANLDFDEIKEKITGRKNQIFLLMEDLRRLRFQQRIKSDNPGKILVNEDPYQSTLPFLPQITEKNLNKYYLLYVLGVVSIILFGGLAAPVLEVRFGLGGSTYSEFIQSMNLPEQLAEVDPIVAAFCGGAVGVISALLVVEVNNIKQQQKNRCLYCEGAGYLTCGNCQGRRLVGGNGQGEESTCQTCVGAGRVMCTACFCTGKQLVSENDPRIDPLD